MTGLLIFLVAFLLVTFFSTLLKLFGPNRNKSDAKSTNFNLDEVFETNKTIWQHNIQKVITVPYYQYQEAFNVFPYFSDYQESNTFLRNRNAPNHLQNQFLVNMHQHEGELFQFWSQQQQKILRSFDATGLGISAELVNFFLTYYNFFLESFRNNVIIYLVNQILVAEMGRALNEQATKTVQHPNYDEYIQASKQRFCTTHEAEVEQIIETLYGDVSSQYATFYQNQRASYDSNQEQTYQEHLYQQEFDEVNRAYRLLEASELMSDEAIKQNYRRLAKQYHPDRNPSEEAKIKMAQINAAYDLIKKIRNL